jgi:hypothetical protein
VTGVHRAFLGLVLFAAGAAVGGVGVSFWPHRVEAPRTWEAIVYLPLTDNSGRRFNSEEWEQALDVLVTEFGGCTLGAEQEGRWLDNDQHVQREPVRPVMITFEHGRLDDFRRSIREVGRRLGQQAMYLRLQNAQVEILDVAPGNSQKDR